MAGLSALEQLFEKTLLANFEKAESFLDGYKFKAIRVSIWNHRGAARYARIVLEDQYRDNLASGLIVLCQNGLLEYSLEQTAIDFGEGELFWTHHIRNAQYRLQTVRNSHGV